VKKKKNVEAWEIVCGDNIGRMRPQKKIGSPPDKFGYTAFTFFQLVIRRLKTALCLKTLF
jgi:hypothetical protein